MDVTVGLKEGGGFHADGQIFQEILFQEMKQLIAELAWFKSLELDI